MKLKVGDYVQLKSYHKLKGIITWIDPVIDAEGRGIHIKQGNEVYRLNEGSVELVFPEQDQTSALLSESVSSLFNGGML